VRAFLRGTSAETGVELIADIPRSFPRFPNTIESAVYRIVQEAVTNALKHSEARRVSVIFQTDADSAIVTVRDDGRGFDTRRPEAMSGIGMVSMRERAEMVGAQLSISSARGKGTEIALRVSLPA
jgi:signal transduction histidine kinase